MKKWRGTIAIHELKIVLIREIRLIRSIRVLAFDFSLQFPHSEAKVNAMFLRIPNPLPCPRPACARWCGCMEDA